MEEEEVEFDSQGEEMDKMGEDGVWRSERRRLVVLEDGTSRVEVSHDWYDNQPPPTQRCSLCFGERRFGRWNMDPGPVARYFKRVRDGEGRAVCWDHSDAKAEAESRVYVMRKGARVALKRKTRQ